MHNLPGTGDGMRVVVVSDSGSTSGIDVRLASLTFTGGDILGDGGGILNLENLVLVDSRVVGNHADRGGGIFSDTGSLIIRRSVVEDNTAGRNFRSGGGIFNREADVVIETTTLRGNQASEGGGVFNEAGNLDIIQSTISGNHATDSGGGIYNGYGMANILSSTISVVIRIGAT